MSFLAWLESTAYSQWIVSGLTGWPLMLSAHAVGLAIIVGSVFVLNLRLFGFFKPIPLTSISDLMSIGWIGIAMNVFSGGSLWMAQATWYTFHYPFIIKIAFIFLGIFVLHYMQRVLKRDSEDWETNGEVSSLGKRLAISSMAFWTIAVVTGRLIAYI
ncbi:MAG: hypothetical protein CBC38_05215 [Gammaproteobacteria bacterium TMED78]|nr:MAG: hypothetical protein CBC38_05215 [Gammaproteobacteria bacterium TMED78]|tara:strand:+ start:18372 stop:18845 length:474 start_codon:yes stop_codon:yes gene_type:complete